MNERRKSLLAAIVLGGLVAGTIDIGAAALISMRGIVFILHAIAGGLLGAESFRGGAGSAVMGRLLQWAMSLVIAAIFVLASSRIGLLKRMWVACGLAYGVGIFAVMNYVVVPLSAWHLFPHFSAAKFVENLLAMLLFGTIVAYFARRPASGFG